MCLQRDGRRYLRIREQAKYLGVNPKTVARWVEKDPSFPAEIELSEGSHGVRVRDVDELDKWVASKKKITGGRSQRSRQQSSDKLDDAESKYLFR